MSIAALNTAGTVLRVGFYSVMGWGQLLNIFPSLWMQGRKKITEGDFVNFAKDTARKFELKKEVILLQDSQFGFVGNNVLPGAAGIKIAKGTSLTDENKNDIEFGMALIRGNAMLMLSSIPSILSIAARCLLIARFPNIVTWAELGVGIITLYVVRNRCASAASQLVGEVQSKNKG